MSDEQDQGTGEDLFQHQVSIPEQEENNEFHDETVLGSTSSRPSNDQHLKLDDQTAQVQGGTPEYPDISIVFHNEAQEMEEINRTFSSVLCDFEGDKSAERFIEEYKKLYESLKESHRQQRHYMLHSSNLQIDIKNNAEKVNLALHLSREDREIINCLSQQVKQAWMEVENMTEKELKAKKAISSLQQEVHMLMMMVDSSLGIEELGRMAEKSAQEHTELENAFSDLKEEMEFKEIKLHETHERFKLKEELVGDELKRKDANITSLEERSKEMQESMEELETSVKRLETIRVTMLHENSQLITDGEQQAKKTVSMTQEVVKLKGKLDESVILYQKQKADSQEKTKELQALAKQIRKMKTVMESHHTLIESFNKQLHSVKIDLDIAQKDLLQKQRQCSSLLKKVTLEKDLKEHYKKEVGEKENFIKTDKVKLSHLQTDLITSNKQIEGLEQRVQNLVRANNATLRIHLKLSKKNKEIEFALMLQTATSNEMLSEVKEMTAQMKSAVTCINALGVDKKKLFGRINQAITLVHKLNDELDTKENLLLTLDKINQDIVGQLKTTRTNLVHMTNQCDSVKNDLHYSELKNEDLFLANANFSKQSSSLAEDLLLKEREISDLTTKFERLKKSMNKQQSEMIEVIKHHDETKLKVAEMEANMYHLEKVLCDKNGRIQELNRDVEKLISQRNIISLQCIRKMEEINFLTDKNSVLEDIVKKGNDQYNRRLQEIESFKFQILDLCRQNKNVMGKLENVDKLRSKLGLANQQLVAAKARYRALEGEHPYNLHRWRHLEAREISHYEMIIKIQFLLKRLINKTDEVTRLEGVIIDKTFVLQEMQNILKRRPGVEALRKAHLQTATKRDMEKKLKAVLAERNIAEWQIGEQKKREDKLNKQLTVEHTKSIKLQKNKQKLLKITSRFPGIGGIAEKMSTSNELTMFSAVMREERNFLPKV